MGIFCLAAYLRSRLDLDFLLMDQRVENASMESVVRRATDFGADVVGLSLMTPYASIPGPLTQDQTAWRPVIMPPNLAGREGLTLPSV